VSESSRDIGLDRAILISNVASGTNTKLGIDGVRRFAHAVGLRHECVAGVDNLASILADCAHMKDPLIILNAGDGTVSRTIEMIREKLSFSSEPVLALLRGGTTNMIHNDVGFSGRPEDALRTLLQCIKTKSCSFRSRHVLRIRQSSRDLPHYGFFFGTHAVVRAILRTRERLHKHVSSGRLSELLSISAMVWRLLRRRVHTDPVLSPVPLDLSDMDGEWCETAHILLLAMSVQKVVLGIRPLRRGQPAGVATLNWPDYRLLPWLWHIVRGRLDELTTVSLRGEFDWVLDGEMHAHGRADGILRLDVADPVHFLIQGPPR
jgi:hypothetical protein